VPAVVYNQPSQLTLTTNGGQIQVYNDFQAMVRRTEEGFNIPLKRHIEEIDGSALVWMHHGYTRDALRAFENETQSTPMIKGDERYDLTLAQYEAHLRRVEEFAFNWDGVVFSFVGLEGPGYDQVQRHLQFLERQMHLRTNPKPLAIVVVPTFTAGPLPYLAVDGRYRHFLEPYDHAFRLDIDWLTGLASLAWLNWIGWRFSPNQKYIRMVWAFSSLYLRTLGIHLDQTFHIGERYSDIPNHGSRFVGQEDNRCVREALEELGGRILPEHCFPGRFGALFDPAVQ
jgi:hypothetical protein